MYDSVLIYSRHHAPQQTASLFFCCKVATARKGVRAFRKHIWNASMESHVASQRSLHYTPIFRLLLKVAVNGTRQCDFLIFLRGFGPNNLTKSFRLSSGLIYFRQFLGVNLIGCAMNECVCSISFAGHFVSTLLQSKSAESKTLGGLKTSFTLPCPPLAPPQLLGWASSSPAGLPRRRTAAPPFGSCFFSNFCGVFRRGCSARAEKKEEAGKGEMRGRRRAEEVGTGRSCR